MLILGESTMGGTFQVVSVVDLVWCAENIVHHAEIDLLFRMLVLFFKDNLMKSKNPTNE